MHTKRHLSLLLQRCCWHLKNLRLLFWIPIVIINLVLPALAFLRYQKDGIGPVMLVDLVENMMLFLPFLSVWWVIFILREYVEADGCEVLYVCRDKIKLADALCPFLLYLLNIALLYGFFTFLFPSAMPMEYGRMLCICCFFFGLTYFLVFLTKSITITLMLDLIYLIASVLIPLQQPVFPLYHVQQELSIPMFYQLYFPLLAAGLIMTVAGTLINQRNTCKN